MGDVSVVSCANGPVCPVRTLVGSKEGGGGFVVELSSDTVGREKRSRSPISGSKMKSEKPPSHPPLITTGNSVEGLIKRRKVQKER